MSDDQKHKGPRVEWVADLSRGGVTRRTVLKGALAAGVTVGCGDDGTSTNTKGGTGASSPGGAGTGGVGGGSAGGLGGVGGGGGAGGSAGGSGGAGGSGSGGLSCTDNGGLSPEELLAPIEHIVVLCMENRSFDHYLGGSLGIEEGHMTVDGLTGMESNPAPNGGPDVFVFAMDNLTPEDPPHGWDAIHQAWNMGQNDQFVIVHEGPNQHQVMGYYVRDQVPIHHALADAYAMCNAYHASVLGPTWPNRFYLHGGTSDGRQSNLPVTFFDSIFDVLADAGLSHRNYHHSVAWATGGYFKFGGMGSYDDFKADAAAGQLPNFSIIDPEFFGGGANDDHPSNADVPLAQLLISDVYDTLATSPSWDKTLFVITYDEHGGFYDHVAPPMAADDDPDFDHLGMRVPALVVGPYVRSGCAIPTTFDHTSVLKTAARRWGLSSLSARMTAANDLSSCIDPNAVKNAAPKPPIMMPPLNVSMSLLRARFEAQGNRFALPHQHPELVDVLKQERLFRRMVRRYDQRERLADYLSDAERRGLVRLRS